MVLVLITHDRGTIEETCFQALTAARALAAGLDTRLQVAVVGADAEGMLPALGEYGVSTVHHVTHPGLDDYAPAAWGSALAQLVEAARPAAVLAIGSDRGNEVMAHVGAITGQPMAANCREVTPTDGAWEISRIRWGGSLLEEATLEAPVKLLTISEHWVVADRAGAATSPNVESFTPELIDADLATSLVERVVTAEGITLATSPVVVSGGRGVGSAEGFADLEALAALLGGVVGCSRVVTNNGWRPHSDQVGQTGTVIAPDLYIACGISGAIQHWVGMMAAKTIIAINTDAEAPMVTKADYAIVGDLKEVVPAIVAEIERRKA